MFVPTPMLGCASNRRIIKHLQPFPPCSHPSRFHRPVFPIVCNARARGRSRAKTHTGRALSHARAPSTGLSCDRVSLRGKGESVAPAASELKRAGFAPCTAAEQRVLSRAHHGLRRSTGAGCCPSGERKTTRCAQTALNSRGGLRCAPPPLLRIHPLCEAMVAPCSASRSRMASASSHGTRPRS